MIDDADGNAPHPLPRWRLRLAIGLVGVVLAYTLAVVFEVPISRIDATHLLLLVITGIVAVWLVQPEAFDRLRRLKLSAFEVELEKKVERVEERQARQGHQLDDIRLIAPLLIPKTERQHLLNLYRGRTQGYRGNGALRAELRRLRSVQLIRSLDDKHVAKMTDGLEFDLAHFVELTDLGERWVHRIEEIEAAEREEDESETPASPR